MLRSLCLKAKRPVINNIYRNNNRCWLSTTKTQYYDSLSDDDRILVDKLISNAPFISLGFSNIYSGNGINDKETKKHQRKFQKLIQQSIVGQFTTPMEQIKFLWNCIKNSVKLSQPLGNAKKTLEITMNENVKKLNIITSSLQGFIITKTLIDLYGIEKTINMVNIAHHSVSEFWNKMLVNYLESNVPHNLRFPVVNGIQKHILNNSVNNEGIFDIEWINDDIFSNELKWNVKRCLFKDIGTYFGDNDSNDNNLAYIWFCSLDKNIINGLNKIGQFTFERNTELAKGCDTCQFKMIHNPKNPDI